MQYTDAIKARMIKRMTGPKAVSAATLSEESGICQPTLSRWLREAGTIGGVNRSKHKSAANRTGKRVQDWTTEEKLAAVVESASLADDELGAFLRRQGLHRSQLEQWREHASAGFTEGQRKRGKSKPSQEQKRIRELERELRRKEKALAEVAALLVLQKKADALFGVEEDDTEPRSGR